MVLRRPLFVSVWVYKDWATAFLPAAPLGIGLRRGTLRSGCSGRWWERRHRADDFRTLSSPVRLLDGPRRGQRTLGRDGSGGRMCRAPDDGRSVEQRRRDDDRHGFAAPSLRFSPRLRGSGHGFLTGRAARHWSATGHFEKWLLRASSSRAAAGVAAPCRRFPELERCQPAVQPAAAVPGAGPEPVWRMNVLRS
jgi:hypothetical protein